jgi:hypothetical protein
LRSDRHFPNPLGIVLLYDIGFLFCEMPRQAVRAQLRSDLHFPNPLGIVLLYDIGFLFCEMARQPVRAQGFCFSIDLCIVSLSVLLGGFFVAFS